MITRRRFLGTGSAWVALGLLEPPGVSSLWHGRRSSPSPIDADPDLGPEVILEGVRFWRGFSGDRFAAPGQHPPFPSLAHWLGPDATPPAPTESSDIVIVGGGLAGLCTAYLLRDRSLLLFEHNRRLGGNSQAEAWDGLAYSIGGAYCIEPDEPLASLYADLGLQRIARVTPGPPGPDPVEVDGRLVENFWYGAGQTPTDRQRFLDFLALVQAFGENYPEIPLPTRDYAWILDLDQKTFKADIEARMGGPLPRQLEAAIQHYCWSSFCAGWEEISAAAGWNFLAAEQFGQWVFPGGTAQIAQRLWERVAAAGRAQCRTECVVLDVRPYRDRVAVTYGRSDGSVRAVLARRVVMACPKFVCRWIMPTYVAAGGPWASSLSHVEYRAYVVVNLLLKRRVGDDFYDAFYLRDGSLPSPSGPLVQDWHRPLDVVSAGWALGAPRPRSVLTLYWPLPYATSRGFLLGDRAFGNVSLRLLEHLDAVLHPLGLRRADIRQVRMTRWGHALPISLPGFLADGHAQRLRQPIDDKIFFVNQDNWALPAVETALLEAFEFAPQVAASLSGRARRSG